MRNILLILAFVIGLVSCKKEDKSTVKNNTGSSPAPTATTLNDSACAEAALTNSHWIFDSIVNYNNGAGTTIVVAAATSSNDFTYDLGSAPYSTGSVYIGYKQLSYQRTGAPSTASYWFVSDDVLASMGYLKLEAGTAAYFNGYIMTLTGNSLVVTDTPSAVKQGMYRYFHK